MQSSTLLRWLVVAVSAAMLLALAAACTETVEVPGETIVVEKEVIKEVQVPGETVVVEKEVIKTVEVPGETVVKEVIKEVMVPGETVVVTKEIPIQVVKTVEIPGPERIKTVEVPGKKYVTDPINGKVHSAPEYGGMITFARQNDYSQRGVDHYGRGHTGMTSPVIEKVSKANWALDRSLFPWAGGLTPTFALTGGLAESWEWTDDRTLVFNIRPGIKWHNRAPMNGRALTAGDVAFAYQRLIGNKMAGNEFSEADPSPIVGSLGVFPWESIAATDDSTLVMKFSSPAPFVSLEFILDYHYVGVQAPEIIREKGGILDWREDLIGTGPFIMTEWTFGENFAYEKNPDYWAMDLKYPDNPTPYIDTLRGLVIAEGATRQAGLRTAKIDYVGQPGTTQMQNIDQILNLARTNPELVLYEWSNRSNNSFILNMSRPPFDNIDVRRAMQMALDLDTMTAAYFSGYADTEPRGTLDKQWAKSGYAVPYEEWPEEIKGYYAYNPEAAEALLDEAGLERGEDGYRFEVEFSHFDRWPVAWSEFAVSYWDKIGVKINLITPAAAEHNAKVAAHDFDIVPTASSNRGNPIASMRRFYSKSPFNPTTSHPDYDAWWEQVQVSTDPDEIRELIKQMDYLTIEQSWLIWGSLSPLFNAAQPWIMGYAGEGMMGAGMPHAIFQWLWVDSELKTGMGH